MNQEFWSPQRLSLVSRLGANKYNGNGAYLVTMDTSDIKDSYFGYSSTTASTKSLVLLRLKYGHKCLLHMDNILQVLQNGRAVLWEMFLSFGVFALSGSNLEK